MAASNIAFTRPYVVVDLEFRPTVTRAGGTNGSTVFVVIRNDGRTPAHNITMTVDRPFAAVSVVDQAGWQKSVEDLNRMMDGVSVLRSLTSTRPLKYVLDRQGIFGSADEPAPRGEVRVNYEDADGRKFYEVFRLEFTRSSALRWSRGGGPWRSRLTHSSRQVRRCGRPRAKGPSLHYPEQGHLLYGIAGHRGALGRSSRDARRVRRLTQRGDA